jgi:hypothetical protein
LDDSGYRGHPRYGFACTAVAPEHLLTGVDAQVFLASAIELGLHSLCIGGFIDHKVNARLRLGPNEATVYSVVVGHAGNDV